MKDPLHSDLEFQTQLAWYLVGYWDGAQMRQPTEDMEIPAGVARRFIEGEDVESDLVWSMLSVAFRIWKKR